jgi:CRP-like cAMP-binding protein
VLLPLASLCETVSLESGDILFEEGEIGDALYIIVRGRVCVERDRKHLTELGAGECVGEMAALDWEARSATVVAISDAVVIRVDRNDLMDTLSDHPELIASLTSVLVERIRRSDP